MSDLSREEWLRSFRRLNILNATEWDEEAAEERRHIIIRKMKKAPVTVVLGHQVRRFLELPEVPWIFPQEDKRGFCWRLIPHPSGRTQTYNDPVFRAAVRIMLQELATK